MRKFTLTVIGAVAGLTAILAVAEQDTTGIGFPQGYRT